MNGKGDRFRGSLARYREGWDRIFGRKNKLFSAAKGKPLSAREWEARFWGIAAAAKDYACTVAGKEPDDGDPDNA